MLLRAAAEMRTGLTTNSSSRRNNNSTKVSMALTGMIMGISRSSFSRTLIRALRLRLR